MTDVRELCKSFLDAIYENNILPNNIVAILKETDNGDSEWDFRLICKLLQYKEEYHSRSPRPNGIESKLEMQASSLKSICIWRDSQSRQRLNDLWQAANTFFHNVKSTDPIFEIALRELLKLIPKNQPKEKEIHPEPTVPSTNQVQPIIGKLYTAKEVNEIFKCNILQGMNFKRKIILQTNRIFKNKDTGNIIYHMGQNINNDSDGRFDQQREKQNQLFCEAVEAYKRGKNVANINVLRKEDRNAWRYKGIYNLIDYKYEKSDNSRDANPTRKVFKFILEKKTY